MKTDDPKFTAHALGELEDLTPAERAEIEALLRDDPSAAAEAAQTQKLAARLRRDLQSEETHALSAAQRAKVLAATHPNSRVKTPDMVHLPRRTWVLSAIAACLIVGLFAWVIHLALKPDLALRRRLAESQLSIAVPTISSDALPNFPPMEVAESPTLLADGLQLSGNMHSPSIAAVTITAPTSVFTVAPSQVGSSSTTFSGSISAGVSSNSLSMAAGTVTLSGANTFTGSTANIGGTLTTAGGGNFPGTMRGRMGSGRASPQYLKRGNEVPLRSENNGAQTSSVSGDVGFEIVGSYVTKGIVVENRDVRFPSAPGNTEAFDSLTDNPFLAVHENPLSTFIIDVDTASYAIVRRFLAEQRQRPPKGAVRIEELLNYFTYDYPQPKGDAPFSATMEVATCPWTPAHRLVRIGLKGREIAKDKRPAGNFVFLIDVSGSMAAPNRLPLVKQSLGLLIDQLGEEDRVAMVVYAGSSGCVLESTHDKAEMRLALSRLEAGGSTNGASGIQLAYQIAQQHFMKGGTNRVILATDGDWNVGITNHSDLFEMIAQKAKGGVFLTVLGFGMGNLKDAMLVKLADKGNGNYGYIDSLLEAKKLLVEQLSGTLVTIAKDVKIQVEFNPAQVSGYRLIGYEKRLLAKEDFNDDKKDAGEIGAGHTVTALYEVVPAGKDVPQPAKVDALKYQQPAPAPTADKSEIKNQKSEISSELLTLKLRYKAPDGDTSKLLEFPLTDSGASWEKSSRDFRFAAAVAGYGMLLRDSPHKGSATWDSVRELAVEGKGEDAAGYRAEFISLLEKARSLAR